MQDIGLLNAIGAKISYLSRRQEIVAQNIANADTPSYRPQDLTEVDFGSLIGRGAQSDKLMMQATQSSHLTGNGMKAADAKEQKQKVTYEVAPTGNAVILEEQMTKSNQIKMEYDLMVNLYQRNVALMKTALGTVR